MKDNVKIFFGGVIVLFFISSCDRFADVAIVTNNTKSDIIVEYQPDQLITDSLLYNFPLPQVLVMPGKSEAIYIPNRVPSQADDSEKVYLYILNRDSLSMYKNSRKLTGILKQSLIKKIEIQLNKIKEPLDTIYVK